MRSVALLGCGIVGSGVARLFFENSEQIARAVRKRGAFAHELLDTALSEAELSAQDAAFARTLVLGCVATSGTLDELIDGVLRSPKDVEDAVRDALRIEFLLEVRILHFLGIAELLHEENKSVRSAVLDQLPQLFFRILIPHHAFPASLCKVS